MNPKHHNRPPPGSPLPERLSPSVWAALLLLTLVIFGAVVLLITLYLRSEIRERIVDRDGEIFSAVAQMLLEEAAGESEPAPPDLFTTALQTSKLSGVLAVRLHEPNGTFTDAVPYDAIEIPLSDEQLESLHNLNAVSTFEPAGELGSVFELYMSDNDSGTVPLLHVAIPLHSPRSGELAGIAYYTLDGEPVAAEFRDLDRSLAIQAGLLFSLGGLLFLLAAGFAFHRLNRAHSLLRERSESLIKANRELTLAAKSSAIGAVTAHLIHGLKNPLAGLNQFVHTAGESGPGDPDDWKAAGETTRRMQAMIDEIVNILREEDATTAYELSLRELADLVAAKIRPRAEQAAVACEVLIDHGSDTKLGGREANLTILILANLLENALQASDSGGLIRLRIDRNENEIRFQVSDQGGGLPESVRENLFSPCKPSEQAGAGIGLAISYQLTQHLGGRLELVESGPAGTVFQLVLVRES